jgi:hypothetical protein
MNELFSKAITALPVYIGQALSLLSGPKAFVLGTDLETPEAGTQAYTFLAITMLLMLIAQVSILPEQKDYLLSFASLTVMSAFWLLLMSAALYFSWRVVGGTLSFRTFFIVSCYFASISTLILVAFTLVGAGFMKYMDPDALIRVVNGNQPSDPNSVGYVGFCLIVAAGLIAVYAWIVLVWGAYRQLNSVSRARSATALAVFTLLSPFLICIQILMQFNLTAAQDRTASGRLPLDMVGLWKLETPPGAQGAASTGAINYVFDDAGNYARRVKFTLRQGSCAKTTTQDSNGHASIQGAMLILAPRMNSQTESSSCSTGESSSDMPRMKEIYPFQIEHLPIGWRLCLIGRFGQQCFLAG